jgi:hypothetical protein
MIPTANIKKYKKQFLHSIIKPHNNSTLVELNPSMKRIIHNTYLIMSTSYFDEDWYNRSIKYTQSLSIEDKFTIKTYTRSGAVVVNKYITKNTIQRSYSYAVQLLKYFDMMNTNLFTDTYDLTEEGFALVEELDKKCSNNIIHNIIQAYINDIQRIINEGPRNQETMILYRGVKTDYIDVSSNIDLVGVCSASYSIDVANTFKEKCIYEMVLLKNTPCIAVAAITQFPKEKEILINIDNLHANVKNMMYKYPIDTSRLGIEPDTNNTIFSEWNYLFNKITNPSYSDGYNENNVYTNGDEMRNSYLKEKVKRIIVMNDNNDTDSIMYDTNNTNNNDNNNDNNSNTDDIYNAYTYDPEHAITITKIGGHKNTARNRRRKTQYELDNPYFLDKFGGPLPCKKPSRPIPGKVLELAKEFLENDSE